MLGIATGAVWLAGCAAPAEPLDPVASASRGLVFVRHRVAQTDLWWARPSDGAEGALLETARAKETWPFWSPAAARLLYETRPAEGVAREQLALFDPATGRHEPLLPGSDRRQHWPTWSPDGTRIAYAFARQRGERLMRGVAEVELATRKRRVRGPPGAREFFFRPEYAPDGSRLAVQLGSPRNPRHQVWILEPEKGPRLLVGNVPRSVGKARFTRDGSWVVLTSRPRQGGPGNLLLVRPDGSRTRLFASEPDASDHSGRPSPVRDEIAFISDRAGSGDLFLADLAGGPPRNLTRSPEWSEMAPRWSPDGERIAVSARPAGDPDADPSTFRLRVIDREGDVDFETFGVMADWMPPPPG